MPSEPAAEGERADGVRLHPASILFDSLRHVRNFAVPALLAMFSTSRPRMGDFGPFDYGLPNPEVWLLILLVPSILFSLARYLSFRLDYGSDELTIRSGLVFRNERRLPYARIQNLDAVQNVLHRFLGVVEVRVETGGGQEPEARLSVLPLAGLDEMRRRVFAGRENVQAGDEGGARAAPPAAAARTLLHLPLPELLLFGFLENKGMVLVGAAYGTLWEAGVLGSVWERVLGVDVDARGIFREIFRAAFGGEPIPPGRMAIAAAGIAGFLVMVRLISMAWAFVRLYDFRLTKTGEDLRAEYGLLTRVTATIPLRRVQTVTMTEGWLHRWLGRAAVRVETAGGRAGAVARDRELVAPLVHRRDLAALLAEILPDADVVGDQWQPVHPRAFRRAVKPALAFASILSLAAIALFGAGGLVVAVPLFAWNVFSTRQHVRHLAWAATDTVVMYRSGWLNRRTTLARVNKIQVVTTIESPLDRRAAMARVRVDTAGAGETSHRVDIPYLAVETARALRVRLSAQAAQTTFTW